MQETYTVPEVIELTRDQLGDIDVPVKMKHVADAIWNAINNLNAVLEALTRPAPAKEETHEDDHDTAGDA